MIMLKQFFVLGALLLCGMVSRAQNSDYKVVFDLTSNAEAAQQQVIRDAGLIKDSHPDAKVEVVLYGQALDLVQSAKSAHATDIRDLIAKKGVSFKVCAIAMKHHHIEPSQLIAGVDVVPDGIYEIISRQKDGYGYIKIAQ